MNHRRRQMQGLKQSHHVEHTKEEAKFRERMVAVTSRRDLRGKDKFSGVEMDGKYQVEAVNDWEGVKKLKAFWVTKQRHPGTDFEFFNVVLQSRKEILSPCVLKVMKNEVPRGILVGRIENGSLPIRLGYAVFGRVPIRMLVIMEGEVIGTDSEVIKRQLMVFIDEIMDRERLHCALMVNIKVPSAMIDAITSVFGNRRVCPAQGKDRHWLMSLPKTWDEFLMKRSRKHRYWLKRLEVSLIRYFQDRWRIKKYTSLEDVIEFVDAAESIASKTYHRVLGVGFRRDVETFRRVVMEARRGQLQGYVLLIDDQPKAFWHCFDYERILYLVATGYDPAFRKYELGTVLLMRIFQEHCGRQIDMVDFGLGDAGYKERFGSEYFEETSLYLFPQTARGILLNVLVRWMGWGNRTAKGILDRLKVRTRIKSYWRRRVEARTR